MDVQEEEGEEQAVVVGVDEMVVQEGEQTLVDEGDNNNDDEDEAEAEGLDDDDGEGLHQPQPQLQPLPQQQQLQQVQPAPVVLQNDDPFMKQRSFKTDNGRKTIYVTEFLGLGFTIKSTTDSADGCALVKASENNICYVGDRLYGRPHGKGMLSSKDYVCEGTFSLGKLDGYAIYIWRQNTRYEGYFVRGRKHGMGSLFWSDGSRYDGQFVDDKRCGDGSYRMVDGRYLVGKYKNDARCGDAIFSWPNGDRWSGTFSDMQHAEGCKTIAATQDRITGKWVGLALENGDGEMVLLRHSDKALLKGTVVNDVFIPSSYSSHTTSANSSSSSVVDGDKSTSAVTTTTNRTDDTTSTPTTTTTTSPSPSSSSPT